MERKLTKREKKTVYQCAKEEVEHTVEQHFNADFYVYVLK